ncbi:MAG: outer membrane beta-barrel protein [Candidatus Marinimicrobia bacterium]|nr:outer membrane beta-barrel protein [Candidatus Neomarinimicrobiota bacterium]
MKHAKIMLLSLLVLLSVNLLQANEHTTGMRITYNSSDYLGVITDRYPMPGFTLGGLYLQAFPVFDMQVELFLSTKGFQLSSMGDTRLSNLFIYLELPVSVRKEFFKNETWNIYVLGGLSAKFKVLAINLVSEIEGVRMFDAGVHAGLGLRYSKVALEARYDQSFINFDLIEPGKYHQSISLGMSFYFRDK